MTSMPQPTDYESVDAYLTDLRKHAWEDQNEFVEASWNRGSIHIPADENVDGCPAAICDHGPQVSASGTNKRTPKRRETSHYQGVWREDRTWCRYCLTLNYPECDYRALQAIIEKGDETPAEGCVISAANTLPVYHTRACGQWPREVRTATRGEVEQCRECERCRMAKQGDWQVVADGLVERVPVDGSAFRVPAACVEPNARIGGD